MAATPEHPFFDYSPIIRRPKLTLPNGARVAVYFGINIEHYTFGQPALSLAYSNAGFVPDPLNYGWRDYAPRVGIWRLMRLFDQFGLRATGVLNSEVCERYPEIVEEGVQRGWAWVAHGRNNSTLQTGMEEDFERQYIADVTRTIEQASGTRPRGWLGPVLTATMNTYNLLAEQGYTYTLDWPNDDQPYPLKVRSGRLINVPYSGEVNDIPIFAIHNQAGPNLYQALVDQFDVLYEEGAESARVMGVGLHPFLAGQPFRAKYLAQALEHITARDRVWFTTSDEVAAWYLGASGVADTPA